MQNSKSPLAPSPLPSERDRHRPAMSGRGYPTTRVTSMSERGYSTTKVPTMSGREKGESKGHRNNKKCKTKTTYRIY